LKVAGPVPAASAGFWPTGWWLIVDFKIGIVPLPVFVILIAVIALYALTGSVPSDILMAIVLLSMGGFACAELGKRIPIIRTAPQRFLPRSSRRTSPFITCCRIPSSAR
jgi:malate:Na+ symporter